MGNLLIVFFVAFTENNQAAGFLEPSPADLALKFEKTFC